MKNINLFNQRFYALLLMIGAFILLFRTTRMMMVENALEILVLWVIALLFIEFSFDLGCLLFSIIWLISNKSENAGLPLKLGAIATILHSIRVLIYVLGRTGPWVNFDVKPIYHQSYQFDWFWVYFAAVLSILGVAGVIIIWQIIRYKKRKHSYH